MMNSLGEFNTRQHPCFHPPRHFGPLKPVMRQFLFYCLLLSAFCLASPVILHHRLVKQNMLPDRVIIRTQAKPGTLELSMIEHLEHRDPLVEELRIFPRALLPMLNRPSAISKPEMPPPVMTSSAKAPEPSSVNAPDAPVSNSDSGGNDAAWSSSRWRDWRRSLLGLLHSRNTLPKVKADEDTPSRTCGTTV